MEWDRVKKILQPFYNREATAVAIDLLGKYLVHVDSGVARVGKIVEVEAYLGTFDKASHSSKGKTARTEVMFGPPGHAYVYLVYGIYHCMNIVTGPEGEASAVLLRALEPVENITGKTGGPGLLCRAMGIDRRYNASDLGGDALFVAEGSEVVVHADIVRKPRVGVAYAGEWADRPLRFYIKGNPFVSRK